MKNIVMIDGFYFAWDRETGKYITNAVDIGGDRQKVSRTPEVIWKQYTDFMSRRLWGYCNEDTVHLTAFPLDAVCDVDCESANVHYDGQSIVCEHATEAVTRFWLAVEGNISERLRAFRRGQRIAAAERRARLSY